MIPPSSFLSIFIKNQIEIIKKKCLLLSTNNIKAIFSLTAKPKLLDVLIFIGKEFVDKGWKDDGMGLGDYPTVSYTHLTLPTILLV